MFELCFGGVEKRHPTDSTGGRSPHNIIIRHADIVVTRDGGSNISFGGLRVPFAHGGREAKLGIWPPIWVKAVWKGGAAAFSYPGGYLMGEPVGHFL